MGLIAEEGGWLGGGGLWEGFESGRGLGGCVGGVGTWLHGMRGDRTRWWLGLDVSFPAFAVKILSRRKIIFVKLLHFKHMKMGLTRTVPWIFVLSSFRLIYIYPISLLRREEIEGRGHGEDL